MNPSALEIVIFIIIIWFVVVFPIIQIKKFRKINRFEKSVKGLLGDKYMIYYDSKILRDFFDFGESPLSAAQEMIVAGRCKPNKKPSI